MMHRVAVPLVALIALVSGCVPPEEEPQGVSYVLAERQVGSLDLVYPQTDTNLAGDYSVTATSRMDFEPSGEGLWEIHYLHTEAGVVTEELQEIPVSAFRVAEGTWAIVVEEDTQMICTEDEAGDLVCVDISEVVSRWVAE